MTLHPQPAYEPIPVKAVIPRLLATRLQKINPCIPADEPAATISRMSTGYELLERTETRKPTIREIRALASFPEGFHLAGTFGQQWARVGNSVPPLLSRAVATEVRRLLDASWSVLYPGLVWGRPAENKA